jgi:hypothetical protein
LLLMRDFLRRKFLVSISTIGACTVSTKNETIPFPQLPAVFWQT